MIVLGYENEKMLIGMLSGFNPKEVKCSDTVEVFKEVPEMAHLREEVKLQGSGVYHKGYFISNTYGITANRIFKKIADCPTFEYVFKEEIERLANKNNVLEILEILSSIDKSIFNFDIVKDTNGFYLTFKASMPSSTKFYKSSDLKLNRDWLRNLSLFQKNTLTLELDLGNNEDKALELKNKIPCEFKEFRKFCRVENIIKFLKDENLTENDLYLEWYYYRTDLGYSDIKDFNY